MCAYVCLCVCIRVVTQKSEDVCVDTKGIIAMVKQGLAGALLSDMSLRTAISSSQAMKCADWLMEDS